MTDYEKRLAIWVAVGFGIACLVTVVVDVFIIIWLHP